MQLVDELSMIYTTCLMCFATFAFGKSVRTSVLLGLFLTSLALFITLYYHYLQDPTFHQNAYALLTAIVLTRCMYVMETQLRPSYLAKQQAQNSTANGATTSGKKSGQQAVKDEDMNKTLNTMWIMIAYGLTIFLLGFAIWNVDNAFCSSLRGWRKEVGLPWGILSEGHGWW
jgi:dihydroceramidase